MSTQILTLTKPKSIGIWVRVSTEMQVQGDSPQHHEARAREYASNKNWTVKKVYKLEAVSGKTIMSQPETQRMLKDIKEGVITGLIISKFARLVRNTRELLELSDLFHDSHADLISLDEPINVSTSSGRLFLTVIGALSEWEREEIGARVAASIPIRAKLGKRIGGPSQFGYRWVNKKLIVDQKEAAVVRFMFSLYLQHKLKKRVAGLLNDAGHRTRNGSKFTDSTIGRLMRDTIFKGKRRANYTKSVDKKKAWVIKPESEWVIVDVEPIVSKEIWEQVNDILDAKAYNHKGPGKRLFSGIAYCECGQKMYPKDYNTTYTCNKDKNKVQEIFLEHYLLDILTAMFSPKTLDALILRAESEIESKQIELDIASKKLLEIKDEMEKCYKAYITEKLDDEDFSTYYIPLKSQSRQLQNIVSILDSEIKSLSHYLISSTLTSQVQKVTQEWWPVASLDSKKWFIENYIKKIVFSKSSMCIDFHHLAPLPNEENIDFTAFNLLCGITANIQLSGDVHDVKVIRSSVDSYKNRSLIEKVYVA